MSKSYKQSLHKLAALFLVFVCGGNLAAFAQTRKTNRAQIAAAQSKQPAAKCSGAWTGTISYTRTQTASNNKTVERVSMRGQDTTNFQMNYDYKARVAVVEAPEKNGSSVGRATVNAKMTAQETVVGKEKNSCDRGKTWQEMSGTSTSKTEMSGSGIETANVGVGISEDGTYSVSVGIPLIKGRVSGSQNSTFSGQCTAKEGKSANLPATETTVDGQSLTSDGTTRVDPSNPNRLSGSYTLKSPGDVVETIVWNLQKCGADVRITDLKFEDMQFPEWNKWKEVSQYESTIDGNEIKIKASILNLSDEPKFVEVRFFETYKGDKYDGARPDRALQGGLTEAPTVKLDAGEEREVEILWRSEGYAWFDDGRPRPVQRFRAEAWESGARKDSLVENLRIVPKPLILVPGVWSSVEDFQVYQNLLTLKHSFDWKALTFDKQPTSVYADADDLTAFVSAAQKKYNAWHVDMAAHSSGGLVGRLYIHKQMEIQPDKRPTVKHFMMLGTPNLGVPCAQDLKKTKFGANFKLADELMPEEMTTFNKFVIERKGTMFSALVGNGSSILCGDPLEANGNDGFTSVVSARYNITSIQYTTDSHQELIKPEHFGDYIKPSVVTGPLGTYPLLQKR